ncbi:hypothetical protein DKG77_09780 [Flagellimonas aquimarina]|jgi:hypothetical protein|uniref:Uncharacterized protein n=1 Tax=Flagellimonas aquimarina TaxID=2201895 RepID=A0A316KWC1_9FLAO|nr:hypothetical protein [Allomuricauda koreensis]PWL38542.1 hypothetical protein DKG77_09780 [Allomuricauda koreensis]
MAQEFSLPRIGQFIRRDLTIHKGTFVTGLLVSAVLLFLFCTLNMVWDKKLALEEFFGIFGVFYIPMGVLFTFSLFKEFNDTKSNHLYLSLPISIPERLAAKWFTLTVIYTAVFSLLAILVGMLAITVGTVIFSADFNVLSIFTEHYWNVIKVYFVIQPIFLVGAITFTKNRIGKTVLSLGLLALVFLLFNFILFAIFNHSYGVFSGNAIGSDAIDNVGEDFSMMGKWFYGLIFGPIMLVVAYFKMIEKEV